MFDTCLADILFDNLDQGFSLSLSIYDRIALLFDCEFCLTIKRLSCLCRYNFDLVYDLPCQINIVVSYRPFEFNLLTHNIRCTSAINGSDVKDVKIFAIGTP